MPITKYYVGTSGWNYSHWKNVFYPKNCSQKHWLEYYASHFDVVEVNATFYRSFPDKTYEQWYNRVPANFHYVVKAPRFITHWKHLINCEDSIKIFTDSTSLLKEKLDLILLQLTPRMPYDLERLQNALKSFPNPKKVAVEFRNEKWLTEATKKLLKKYKAVFCNVDSSQIKLMDWLTSSAAYIRLHGGHEGFTHNYSKKEIQMIAELAFKLSQQGAKKVYVFFNNDYAGYAVKNALSLRKILGY